MLGRKLQWTKGWRQKFVEGEGENEKATRGDGPLIVGIGRCSHQRARMYAYRGHVKGRRDSVRVVVPPLRQPLLFPTAPSLPLPPTIHAPCLKGAPIISPLERCSTLADNPCPRWASLTQTPFLRCKHARCLLRCHLP